MIQSWLSHGKEGLKSTSEDTRTLALHVLAYVGFQKSYPFKIAIKQSEGQEPATYRDSLSVVLQNILVIIIVPAFLFQMPVLPAKWRQIGLAVTSFRKYMLDQLSEEKRLIAEGKPESGTLMSNLVRASEARQGVVVSKDEEDVANNKPHEVRALSVDEILGNIFVFNFAGHDTTAISLAFSMLLLVAHPDIQDWISEELNFYLETTEGEKWGYEGSFPRLKRCSAVLVRLSWLETQSFGKSNLYSSLKLCGCTILYPVCPNTPAIDLGL